MTQTKNWNLPYVLEELKVHRDARGDLYEAIRFSSQEIPKGGQIYVYTIAPGMRRGDHFHEHKSEWFTCVAGQARLLMRTEDGILVDEMLSSDAPRMAYAGPGTSHALINDASDVAVIMTYASKEFDPSDPDTIFKLAD
jgi:UDP-2-acetamido-2,6-beta-L-arabino-hexul-4-ose reductase